MSDVVCPDRIGWWYDPVLISKDYPLSRHINVFAYMARELSGFTHTAVISFIDPYEKTKRNYPEARAVTHEECIALGKAFIKIGMEYDLTIKPCAEGDELAAYGADCSGCMTIETFEKAIGAHLKVPAFTPARDSCACYLSCDIGAYITCGHLCRYRYANYDAASVRANMKVHDPKSPLLAGHLQPEDIIRSARQESWIDLQIRMEM